MSSSLKESWLLLLWLLWSSPVLDLERSIRLDESYDKFCAKIITIIGYKNLGVSRIRILFVTGR